MKKQMLFLLSTLFISNAALALDKNIKLEEHGNFKTSESSNFNLSNYETHESFVLNENSKKVKYTVLSVVAQKESFEKSLLNIDPSLKSKIDKNKNSEFPKLAGFNIKSKDDVVSLSSFKSSKLSSNYSSELKNQKSTYKIVSYEVESLEGKSAEKRIAVLSGNLFVKLEKNKNIKDLALPAGYEISSQYSLLGIYFVKYPESMGINKALETFKDNNKSIFKSDDNKNLLSIELLKKETNKDPV